MQYGMVQIFHRHLYSELKRLIKLSQIENTTDMLNCIY